MDKTVAGLVTVTETPSIPMGCVCAFTWGGLPPTMIRNGPRSDCPVHGT